ncbi:SatD family protein [soil metagenome]
MDLKTQPSSPLCAAVLGDVVGSRTAPDRVRLHRAVTAALSAAADGAVDPPALTVGDEFQGVYATVGDAVDAALSIRLALQPQVDIRFGIGWGEVTLLDETTRIQDGPGWWAAREAIEWTAAARAQPGLALVRTAFRNTRTNGPDAHAVNAALMCRDHLLGSLDDRSLRLLTGLRAGRSKKELAMAEGISASAVSQRTSRAGLDLILAASQDLRQL